MPTSLKDAYLYCPRCGELFAERSDSLSTCSECGLHLYHSPKPCVGIILVGDDGKLLMVRRGRDPHIGTWDVPGGFCEINETVIEAAIREAEEELHVKIEVDTVLDSLPEKYPYNNIEHSILSAFVIARIVSGQPTPDDDIDDMKYFTAEEALGLPFGFPSLKKGIQMYIDEIKKDTP